MTLERFVQTAAVLMGAGWISYSLESLAPVHPVIRRGLQVLLTGAAGVWCVRVIQTL